MEWQHHKDDGLYLWLYWEKAQLHASHVEMIGLIGAGNNPMVGMTVAVAVAIEEAQK